MQGDYVCKVGVRADERQLPCNIPSQCGVSMNVSVCMRICVTRVCMCVRHPPENARGSMGTQVWKCSACIWGAAKRWMHALHGARGHTATACTISTARWYSTVREHPAAMTGCDCTHRCEARGRLPSFLLRLSEPRGGFGNAKPRQHRGHTNEYFAFKGPRTERCRMNERGICQRQN